MASDAPCSDTGSSHKELYTPLMEFVHYMLPFLQVLRGISSEYAHVYTCIVSQDWIYPSVSISFRFHSLFLLSQVPVYGSFRKAFSNIRSVLVDKCDVPMSESVFLPQILSHFYCILTVTSLLVLVLLLLLTKAGYGCTVRTLAECCGNPCQI